MGFVESVLYPVLSILPYLNFFAILVEFVAWTWNNNMDWVAFIKILLRIKMARAGSTDQVGIYRCFYVFANWQELLLKQKLKYKDGLQEARCDWMHAFSGAPGEL